MTVNARLAELGTAADEITTIAAMLGTGHHCWSDLYWVAAECLSMVGSWASAKLLWERAGDTHLDPNRRLHRASEIARCAVHIAPANLAGIKAGWIEQAVQAAQIGAPARLVDAHRSMVRGLCLGAERRWHEAAEQHHRASELFAQRSMKEWSLRNLVDVGRITGDYGAVAQLLGADPGHANEASSSWPVWLQPEDLLGLLDVQTASWERADLAAAVQGALAPMPAFQVNELLANLLSQTEIRAINHEVSAVEAELDKEQAYRSTLLDVITNELRGLLTSLSLVLALPDTTSSRSGDMVDAIADRMDSLLVELEVCNPDHQSGPADYCDPIGPAQQAVATVRAFGADRDVAVELSVTDDDVQVAIGHRVTAALFNWLLHAVLDQTRDGGTLGLTVSSASATTEEAGADITSEVIAEVVAEPVTPLEAFADKVWFVASEQVLGPIRGSLSITGSDDKLSVRVVVPATHPHADIR